MTVKEQQLFGMDGMDGKRVMCAGHSSSNARQLTDHHEDSHIQYLTLYTSYIRLHIPNNRHVVRSGLGAAVPQMFFLPQNI